MGPEMISLIGGIPFLPGPLEQSSTVWKNYKEHVIKKFKKKIVKKK